MRIWNADGGAVEQCGNAARCVGWLMMEATGRDAARLETPAGVLDVDRAGPKTVTVDMGKPGLDWRDIPLEEAMDTRGIELQVGPIDNPVLHTPGASRWAIRTWCSSSPTPRPRRCARWAR